MLLLAYYAQNYASITGAKPTYFKAVYLHWFEIQVKRVPEDAVNVISKGVL